jgi:hypothetical protein
MGRSGRLVLLADQLDRVAVRVLDKRDNGGAGIHRAGIADDLAAA